RVPTESGPPLPPVLIPAQLACGLFMARRDRVAPRRIAGQRLHRGRGRPMAPGALPLRGLAPRGACSQPPADLSLVLGGDAPAAHRHERLAPPPRGALPPADRPPLRAGHTLEQRVRPLDGPHRPARPTHSALSAPGDHLAFVSDVPARQAGGMFPIGGGGDHRAIGDAPRACLLPPRQGARGHGLQGHVGRDAGFAAAFGGFSPRLRQLPPHPHWPRRWRIGVAAGHRELPVAHLAHGPRVLTRPPTAALPCLGKPVSSSTNTPSPRGASATIVATRWPCRSASSHGLLVRNSCQRCALVPGMAWALGAPCW